MKNETYEEIRSLVKSIFYAIKKRGYGSYQAFDYTYDETEILFSRGSFNRLFLLNAIFFLTVAMCCLSTTTNLPRMLLMS